MNIEVPYEFVEDALCNRFDICRERGWVSDAAEALWEQALELVEFCGLGSNCTSASLFVDNYCINGEFYSKDEWLEQNYPDEESEDVRQHLWEKFCEYECVLYNDEYACRKF